MESKLQLQELNSRGDDRNLAKNGDDRHYWYSILDMMTLLIDTRKTILQYDENTNLDPENKYWSIRQNKNAIFLTDPYYFGNFAKNLNDDINRIIGIHTNVEQNKQKWHNYMPKLIVIPLISGMHWRTVAIQIEYEKVGLNILYDDPYGGFPKSLMNDLLPSIKQNCQKLIGKYHEINNHIPHRITVDLDVENIENKIDQQGGNNQWDCGPITLINVQDCLNHFIKYTNLHQVLYTIGRHDVDPKNHEKSIIDFRIAHIKTYGEISKVEIDKDRHKKLREDWNKEKDKKKAEIKGKFGNHQKIEELDDFYLEMFFTVLENLKLFDPNTNDQESIKYALKFVENEQKNKKIQIFGEKNQNEASVDNNYRCFTENSQLRLDETRDIIKNLKPDLFINKGTDEFISFIKEQSVYIDKSLLIKTIISSGGHMFITAPQRWGKSLNLTMIRDFFQPDGDDPNHYNENGKYDFSRGNIYESEFKKLKIAGEKLKDRMAANGSEKIDIIQKYQGKCPVIYLNFRGVHGFENLEELFEKLRDAVCNAFDKHEYWYKKQLEDTIKDYKMINPAFKWSDEQIKNSDTTKLERIMKLNHLDFDANLKIFKAYHNGEIIAEAPLSKSIEFLCKILWKHYDRKIMILVDEFDKPVISILPSLLEKITKNHKTSKRCKNYFIKVANTAASLISDFIKASSNMVSQVILTGIFNTLDKSLSSSVNGVREFAIVDMREKVTKYFGFDDEDIQTICDSVLKKEISADLTQKLKDMLKYWYNGQYICGKKMYIPSSVMEYFIGLNQFDGLEGDLPKFKCYWEQTQTSNLLRPILDAISREEINLDNYLLKLKDIALGIHVPLVYDPDKSLIAVMENFKFDENSLERIFSHLLIKSGLLTLKDIVKNTYGYPANEVKLMIENVLMEAICKKFVFQDNWGKFHNLARNTDFSRGDVSENIGKAINLVKNTYENFNEDTFKCILHTMFADSEFKNGATIAIEAYAGRGYIDVVLYLKEEAKIFELKFENNVTGDKKEQLMLTAKWQIPEQGYLSLVLRKLCEESKKAIKQIKLTPMLLFRIGNNAPWQCEASNSCVLVLTIEEAKLVESFFNQDEIKESLGFTKCREDREKWKHIEGRDSRIENLRKTLLAKQKVADFEGLLQKIKECKQSNVIMKIEEVIGDESVNNPHSRDEEIRKQLLQVKKEEREQAFQEIKKLITEKGENLQISNIMSFQCSVKGIGQTTKNALCKVIFGTTGKSETKVFNSKKRKEIGSPLPFEKRIKIENKGEK